MFKKKNESATATQESVMAVEPALRDDNVGKESDTELRNSEESEGTENLEETENPANSHSEEPEKSENAENSERQDMSEALEKAYCLGAGIDEETLAKAKEIIEVLSGGNEGSGKTLGGFNPKSLQMAIRLLRYEDEIEAARRSGYEAARSELIADAFRDRRSRAEQAAAIPHFSGSGNMAPVREESIFDVAKGVK